MMACAIGGEMESLQATLDFIANFDLPQVGLQNETALLDVINEERELLALGERLEADVSLNTLTLDKFSHGSLRGDKNAGKGSPTSSHVDVASLATDAPWPEKLESLQASAQVADAARAKGETNVTDLTLWKGVASRQLALRRHAEAMNAKLRDEVVAQAKYAANLKRMLKRRYSDEMLELVPIMNRGRIVEDKATVNSHRILDELLGGTDYVYMGVDALLAKKGMTQVPCPGSMKKHHSNTVDGLFLEFMDKNQVPFGLRSTTNAVWKAFQAKKTRAGDHVQTKLCAQDTKPTETAMTSYMSYTCNAAGHSTYVQERRVARKYVEPDRSVFVGRALIDPTSRSVGFLGLLFQESLVVVVRRGEPLASGQEISVIESYMWVTRCDDGKEEAVKFREPLFTDLAVNGWDRKLSLFSQTIENILFDGAVSSAM
ncbi:hypothetical protein PF008_g7839 [Phytophthora fragariae]|uniref:Uncharacterized protein n=1 Tax=Phytophthora fragariae TaxID=53985 RepID=A0A6G0S1A7_9STRA|nr:hypothetical protein PF008_g7839 [Phytophthora fragariae]